MSCYLLHVGTNGKHSQYRVPSVSHALCRNTCVRMMFLSKSTYLNWIAVTVLTRQALPVIHGLTGSILNAANPAAEATVRQYIRDVAELDGHALPVAYCQSDFRRMEDTGVEESVIFLPSRYSK